MTRVPRIRALFCGLALAFLAPIAQARAQGRPITLAELERTVRSGAIAEARLIQLIRDRCLAFTVDEGVLRRLREAGAKDPLLNAVRSTCRVLAGEPRWIQLSPLRDTVRVGESVQLKVVALSPDSSVLPSPALRWTSSNPAIAAVTADGRVQGKAPGNAYVTAITANGILSNAASILVRGPASTARPRNPATAMALAAVVPGGGQFYTGRGLKGAMLLAGAGAAVAIGFAVTTDDVSVGSPETGCPPTCTYDVTFERKRPAIIPGLIAAGGLWAYGIVDATRAARPRRQAAAPAPSLRILGDASIAWDGTVTLPLLRVLF